MNSVLFFSLYSFLFLIQTVIASVVTKEDDQSQLCAVITLVDVMMYTGSFTVDGLFP